MQLNNLLLQYFHPPCFQCQELGHITSHCPHIRCLECNENGHIIIIALTKNLLQEHWQHITRHIEVTAQD